MPADYLLIPSQHLAARRRLHLLDLENLCGSNHLTPSLIDFVIQAYLRDVVVEISDLVIVGVSHHNMLDAGIALPGVRLCVRSGPDGADLALLDVLANEAIEERFDSVYIGTGDGIFATTIASLSSAGIDFTVVGGLGAMSRRLRMAARNLVQLSFDTLTQEHA
ncbi:NYN domain-containing protein [Rhodococcoides fascians]|uniref:NYN domain-containing protein n=1 Tax=Rhodococcoides fascians TaxID=1828 RepID=UPI001E4DE377|nr:NYN domain-containing protein [Rhodococcus fascians]